MQGIVLQDIVIFCWPESDYLKWYLNLLIRPIKAMRPLSGLLSRMPGMWMALVFWAGSTEVAYGS